MILFLGFLLYWVGFILFGVAVWRSATLPKWAGVLLAIHPLLILGLLRVPLFIILGGVLLIMRGGWIALSILRQPWVQEGGPEAQTRVR